MRSANKKTNGGGAERRCRVCGRRKMRPIDGWACAECQEIGAGKNAMANRYIRPEDAKEILNAMRARETEGMEILQGLGNLEINAVARLYSGTAYNSYGRLRAYCDNTGEVPPMEGEK